VSTADAAIGDLVIRLEGMISDCPTRYSVQIGIEQHLDCEPHEGGNIENRAFRFTDHSCDPNMRFRKGAFFAIKNIRVGDKLTFDYETTEWEMFLPFECQCGASTCRDYIRGFKFLSIRQRRSLRESLSEHLLVMHERETNEKR
jgi:hypothetical protein